MVESYVKLSIRNICSSAVYLHDHRTLHACMLDIRFHLLFKLNLFVQCMVACLMFNVELDHVTAFSPVHMFKLVQVHWSALWTYCYGLASSVFFLMDQLEPNQSGPVKKQPTSRERDKPKRNAVKPTCHPKTSTANELDARPYANIVILFLDRLTCRLKNPKNHQIYNCLSGFQLLWNARKHSRENPEQGLPEMLPFLTSENKVSQGESINWIVKPENIPPFIIVYSSTVQIDQKTSKAQGNFTSIP